MSGTTSARERMAWTAAVAVLSTSIVWLGVINVALFLSARESQAARAWLVIKALGLAAWAVARDLWPIAPVALAAAVAVLLAASAAAPPATRERSA